MSLGTKLFFILDCILLNFKKYYFPIICEVYLCSIQKKKTETQINNFQKFD